MTQASANGLVTEPSVEEKVDTLIWLHAELAGRFMAMAQAFSAMLAQQMQPQVQKAILAQLTGAAPPGPVL